MHGRPRAILHADMDAFYASVEQRDRPELRDRPVAVGGSSARGVVMTASYEARRFGVHSAMPATQAKRLCPDAIFVKPRLKHYAAVARQVRAVFAEFTPLVEPLSLDEAFLDVTGSLKLFGAPLEIGRTLKRRVREITHLTVSVGIGPTKTIAKIASAMGKPDGLLEVTEEHAVAFLQRLPVERLWGVGPSTHAVLQRLGIATIGDLAEADPVRLQRHLGRAGPWLFDVAHGRDDRSVNPQRQRKSYGEEQTFDRDLEDGEALRRVIAAQADAVARRLRTDDRVARTVTLKIKLAQRLAPGKYPVLTRRVTLDDAVDDAPSIAAAALRLWQSVGADKRVRLIGVSVSSIDDADRSQLGLFDSRRRRNAALDRTLDNLRARFGNSSVRRGS
jgi:DNA polymerase-4